MQNIKDINTTSETDLALEAEELQEKIRQGTGSVRDANRLAHIQQALSRINSVKSGKFW